MLLDGLRRIDTVELERRSSKGEYGILRNITLPGIILGIVLAVGYRLIADIIRMPFDP
jgi:hypothetical protein